MKTFYFTDLRSHGSLRQASTPILQPCWAVVRAGSLGEAKRALRAVGLNTKIFTPATRQQSALVEDLPPGTVVWATMDERHDPVVGMTVDEWVEAHPSGAFVRYTHRDGTTANNAPF